MAVVANVNSNTGECRIKCGIAQITGAEIEFLPKAWIDVRNVVLTILAKIFSVGVDYGSSVVIDAGDLFLINRDDDDHPMSTGNFLHQAHSGPVGNFLDRFVPASLLFGTKVRRSEDLLHAENLHSLFGGFLNEAEVFLDIEAFNIVYRQVCWCSV